MSTTHSFLARAYHLKPMVSAHLGTRPQFDKEAAKAAFAKWLDSALTANGIVEGRGRPQVVAKRYRVSVPAARKWLEGVGMPDMAQLAVIVRDLAPLAPRGDALIDSVSAVMPTSVGEALPDYSLSISEIRPGYVRIPLLDMEGGMGPGMHADTALSVVDYLDVAAWWADINLPRPIDRIKLITGRGDSNAPLINHGDIVFVDVNVDHFDGEGLYVFNWQGHALIKRLVPNMRGNGLRIVSANPAYPPEDISLDEMDQLHISGRVVAWYSLRRN